MEAANRGLTHLVRDRAALHGARQFHERRVVSARPAKSREGRDARVDVARTESYGRNRVPERVASSLRDRRLRQRRHSEQQLALVARPGRRHLPDRVDRIIDGEKARMRRARPEGRTRVVHNLDETRPRRAQIGRRLRAEELQQTIGCQGVIGRDFRKHVEQDHRGRGGVEA